jgi:hypothetical protein
MTTESNTISDTAVRETVFQFTTIGGGLLIQRIAEIEKLALGNLQSGKSLDRVVTGALVLMRDACRDARASVT